MPRRELSRPSQVEAWLQDWGQRLATPASMILIGSGGLLWHAAQAGKDTPLPANSMDVDPITNDDALAELCYEAIIGSEFEQLHGWHVNLMPALALDGLPAGWDSRARRKTYGLLLVIVPTALDLLAPKQKRNEPRDREHSAWAESIGLLGP